MTTDLPCGTAARRRGDPLPGTAAHATSWLLVEHPGPWPRRAFEDYPADPATGAAIARRARASDTRPLFIRRHGRAPTERRFAFVDGASRSIGWSSYENLAEILDAAWQADSPLTEPLYLVCTHGRHDRCCAVAGRPVAAELSRAVPERTWECSHLGGDRFAGNLLMLPWGATYGFVDTLDVPLILEAGENGLLHLPLLRGCATDRPVVQTARIAAQRLFARPQPDALPVAGIDQAGPDRWLVHLADPVSAAVVTVERVRVPDARATCAHAEPGAMHEWRVLDVVPA